MLSLTLQLSDNAQYALDNLRVWDFQWYLIPFLVLLFYMVGTEIEKKNWNGLLAAAGFFLMDWFNELWNALWLHFSGYSAPWLIGDTGAGSTAFISLAGWNIEIMMMFLMMGLYSCKPLLDDKKTKILGIPNRWFFAIVHAAMAVIVEIGLNAVGALVWDYPWWSAKFPLLIFLFGYLHFFVVAYWIFDMESRKKQIITVGVLFAIDLIASILFIGILGWI
ncbi:MAG: hypothetical protein ACTSWW_03490 [Promethearchaeota archaeon]